VEPDDRFPAGLWNAPPAHRESSAVRYRKLLNSKENGRRFRFSTGPCSCYTFVFVDSFLNTIRPAFGRGQAGWDLTVRLLFGFLGQHTHGTLR
jgi:hypothetical protein